MTAAEKTLTAHKGWGTTTNDRLDSKAVGREPDLFIAASPAEKGAVDLLNKVVVDAVNLGASDIHFESQEEGMLIRFRVNGDLEDIKLVDTFMGKYIDIKLREKGKLTVNERGTALDSRMSFRVDGNPVDMRMSLLPTRMGASVVCRILDQSGANRRLADVWMHPKVREQFHSILGKPEGMFLMTGPTGSGKTSTLYAALNEVNTRERKILTIEDPVEYRLAGANQVEITRELSFAQALRSALRQDPDIILVGEIRDSETAKTALQAAMTGHLVLSTLHANSAAATLTRLTDLGIDPFTLGASICGVVAQRLAQRLCDACKVMRPLNEYEQQWVSGLGMDPHAQYGDKGHDDDCPHCDGRGVKGRLPVMEMIIKTDALRHAIESGSVKAIEQAAAHQDQYESLGQCATRMAQEGLIPFSSAAYIGGA